MKSKLRTLTALFSILCLAFTTAYSQTLINHEQLGSTSKAVLEAQGFFAGGAFDIKYGIDFYKITYETPGVNGGIDTASGMVVFPNVSNCGDGLTLTAYEHGTVLRKENVPSRNNSESNLGKLMAGIGMVTVMPDYLGLGDAPGYHPYIHAESQATATIDAFRAARDLADVLGVNLNGDVLITGYSQGGHAALATHEYIETNDLTSEFNLLGSAPCSGPYDMSGVQSEPIVQGAAYDTPGYVIYLLNGYQTAYGNVFDSIQEVLQPQFRSNIPPMLDGNSSLDDLNNALPQEIDSFLTADFLTTFRAAQQSGNHPLWENLADNDLYNWTPKSGVRMFYCTEDEQVFYQNSLIARDEFRQSGAVNVSAVNRGAQGHAGCLVPALSGVAAYFDSLLVICGEPVIEDTAVFVQNPTAGEVEITLYPNPAESFFQLKTEHIVDVEVFDQAGRQMFALYRVSAGRQIAVNALASGTYFVRVTPKDGAPEVLKLLKK